MTDARALAISAARVDRCPPLLPVWALHADVEVALCCDAPLPADFGCAPVPGWWVGDPSGDLLPAVCGACGAPFVVCPG